MVENPTFEFVVEKIKNFINNGQIIKIEGFEKTIHNKAQLDNQIIGAKDELKRMITVNQNVLNDIDKINKTLEEITDSWKKDLINSKITISNHEIKALGKKYSNPIDFFKDANKLHAMGLLNDDIFGRLQENKKHLEVRKNDYIDKIKQHKETEEKIKKFESQIKDTRLDIPSTDYSNNLLKLMTLASKENVSLDDFLENIPNNVKPLPKEQSNKINELNKQIKLLDQKLNTFIENYCKENNIRISEGELFRRSMEDVLNRRSPDFKQIFDKFDQLKKEKQNILEQEVTINKLILRKINELQPKVQRQEVQTLKERLLNEIRNARHI